MRMPSRDNAQKSGIAPVDLVSIRQLEFLLNLDRKFIREIAAKAASFYEPFEKREKTRYFAKKAEKPKKKRVIDNPGAKLKLIQRRIYRKILRPIVMPPYVLGGIKGRDVLQNVQLHCGSRVLVTVDIRSFFPSVNDEMTFSVWRNVLGCSTEIASLLTKLTTFQHRLPQGAPTSSPIANILISSIDADIQEFCVRNHICYSTWIDDLAFSGNDSRGVINVAIDVLHKAGFSISRRKLHIMGPGDKKILTGLLLNKNPNVTRARYSQVRAGLHRLETGAVGASLLPRYLQSLKGSIDQIFWVNPGRGQKLRDKYQEIAKEKNRLQSTASAGA